MNNKIPAGELLPCPFCGGPANIKAVARDWWKIVASHEDACILSGHFDDAIVPQDDESKADLINRWNSRAADRELRRGDVGMPTAAWRYMTNNAHTHIISIEPPDDAYDAGTLAPLVLLADAQAALAAKGAAEADMYLRLCDAAGYTSGKDGLEFSPEEWVEAQAAELEAALKDRVALAVEIEELRKDKERLDYLVSQERQVWEVNGRYWVRHVTEAHNITAPGQKGGEE